MTPGLRRLRRGIDAVGLVAAGLAALNGARWYWVGVLILAACLWLGDWLPRRIWLRRRVDWSGLVDRLRDEEAERRLRDKEAERRRRDER